jgi:hypothetical protein
MTTRDGRCLTFPQPSRTFVPRPTAVFREVIVPEIPKIFISYRREDSKHVAGRIADHFSRNYADVFMDLQSIRPGYSFSESIRKALRSSSVVLVIIGELWLRSADTVGRRRIDKPDDWVAMEIREALATRGVRVAPILVDEARMPSREDLPASIAELAERQAFRVRYDAFQSDLDHLMGLLELPIRPPRGYSVNIAGPLEDEDPLSARGRYRSIHWMRRALSCAAAVARIETDAEDGIGTGFLADGAALHPHLPAAVLVTAGHVVPEAISAKDAVVAFRSFDEADGRRAFRLVRQWWYSPSKAGLNIGVFELDGFPLQVGPLRLSENPRRWASNPSSMPRKVRVNLIGHPRGLATPRFTIQDNRLMEIRETTLRYRAAAEAGSSGCPVFDDAWGLLGVHQRRISAGVEEREGTLLAAVAAAMQSSPPVGLSVQFDV